LRGLKTERCFGRRKIDPMLDLGGEGFMFTGKAKAVAQS